MQKLSASTWEVFLVVVVVCFCLFFVSFVFCLFVSLSFCPILFWKLMAHYVNNNVGWLFVS